ncbi:hypothetical protein evm_001501 [Chilo suppressalis]|nr:hypothetical protein evm_001501 [Chilo suppressalis]
MGMADSRYNANPFVPQEEHHYPPRAYPTPDSLAGKPGDVNPTSPVTPHAWKDKKPAYDYDIVKTVVSIQPSINSNSFIQSRLLQALVKVKRHAIGS